MGMDVWQKSEDYAITKEEETEMEEEEELFLVDCKSLYATASPRLDYRVGVMKVRHIRYLHSCVTESVFSVSILEDSFLQNFLFKLV